MKFFFISIFFNFLFRNSLITFLDNINSWTYGVEIVPEVENKYFIKKQIIQSGKKNKNR